MNTPEQQAQFAKLPSVDRVLLDNAAAPLIESHGRKAVTAAIRNAIAELRTDLLAGTSVDISSDAVLSAAARSLAQSENLSLVSVYNLTGTVLHTNLGRAALPQEALDAVMTVAAGASNLEYDLTTGRRGERDDHIEAQITAITGAEAATVVNNNAAAVMLVLNTLGFGKGVAVSRGELVEIGGSFRVPDIMARSGCELIEVGTTNRTHLKDFRAALVKGAGMIMKVHTSNYVIEGFTAVVPEPELGKLAAEHDVPFVNDLGSGTLINLDDYGLPHEPTPMEALKAGADVVTFSGDKLLGGPQAGIIVGCKELVDKITANPMKRALRCDKMTMAALSSVLRLYDDPDRLAQRLPTLRWLTRSPQEISVNAEPVAAALRTICSGHADIEIIECQSQIGSGALPTRTVASIGIACTPPTTETSVGNWLAAFAAAFRKLPKPVIGRIHDDRFILDLRCLDDISDFIINLEHLELPQ
ncbi:MAG: L-seryl-tRNA(Ser) seleniumtransferase [Hyphomicrobiaceae bacterium]|jgi:L-seryl-tRNA(Ser) seleniumtransferase